MNTPPSLHYRYQHLREAAFTYAMYIDDEGFGESYQIYMQALRDWWKAIEGMTAEEVSKFIPKRRIR